MNWRVFLTKLETFLKQRHLQIDFQFYISRRKRYIHLGLEKSLSSHDHKKILGDIEKFWLANKEKNFEFINPPILVKTVK